jgi:hypothetical protein
MSGKLMRGSWWTLFLFLIATRKIFACAVCGTAIEASRQAFIYSTTLLTLMPLFMVGGLVYYLFRASRSRQQEELSQGLDSETVLPVSGEDKIG